MVAIKEVDSLPLTLIQGGSISNSSNTCVFIGVLRRGWRDTSYLNTKNGTQATEYLRKYLRYVYPILGYLVGLVDMYSMNLLTYSKTYDVLYMCL